MPRCESGRGLFDMRGVSGLPACERAAAGLAPPGDGSRPGDAFGLERPDAFGLERPGLEPFGIFG